MTIYFLSHCPSLSTSLFLQLTLRHRINPDILIYPGYAPQKGVEPRVFHYGLKFGVGNWSFDKADWRNTDVVNICWSKFPDPPDPSTLSSTDVSTLRQDKLSIECAQKLNEALYLHHKRRKCIEAGNGNLSQSTKNVSNLRWQGRKKATIRLYRDLQQSLHDPPDVVIVHPRYWMVCVWTLSVFGFLLVLSVVLSRKKVDRLEQAKAKE